MGYKEFSLYILLQQYRYDLIPNTAVVSVDILYDEIKFLRICCKTKNDIAKLLFDLKELNIIYFNNKDIINYNIPIIFNFIDTPQTHRELKENKEVDIPDSAKDNYLVVNTKIFNYIMQQDLTVKHFILYLAIKKYSYSQQNTVSCETLSEWTGFGVHQINKNYIPDLERIGLVKNNISRNSLGHRQNNFQVLK